MDNLNFKTHFVGKDGFIWWIGQIPDEKVWESQIKNGEAEVMGNKTRVKVVKNKVAPPFKIAEFDILYGEGISKIGEVIDLGVDYEIIKKSGSWFSYGETKIGQGRDAVKSLLTDNPDLLDELEAKITECIKSLE